jgi:hypothetical protein
MIMPIAMTGFAIFPFLVIAPLAALIALLVTRPKIGVIALVAMAIFAFTFLGIFGVRMTSIPTVSSSMAVRTSAPQTQFPNPVTSPNEFNAAIQQFVANATTSNLLHAESSLCATPSDAEDEARSAAADELLPYVQSAMQPQIEKSQLMRSIATNDWLKGHIKSALVLGSGITDRKLDRIEKPYGMLWKQSFTIDATPSSIQNNFAKPLEQLADSQANGWRTQAGGVLGLSAIIFLLYLFLNSATKGYFVWKLRAAAVLVVIVALLSVFAFA